ncbi:DUF6603 domain-containing protein [Dactylosporangium sp. NPDC049140]|uniref:DUF6603 domain-containing protein n=1 Tax=Dactylosporangium sp. NPDC049140 TaxID=3155647 RepID=UPI0033E95C76
MDKAGTVERLGLELARAIGAMGRRMTGERLLDLLAELGTVFPPQLVADARVRAAQQTVAAVTDALEPATAALQGAITAGDDAAIAVQGAALLARCGQIGQAYQELGGAIGTVGPTLPGVPAAQVADLVANLPRKLLDLAVLQVVDPTHRLTGLAGLFGLAEVTRVDADPANPAGVDHQRIALRLDRLPAFLVDPVGLLRQRYGWGGPALDGGALLGALRDLLESARLPGLLEPAAGGQPARLEAWALDVTVDAGGLALSVVMPVGAETTTTLDIAPPTWVAQVTAAGLLPAGTTGRLSPPLRLELQPPDGPATLRGELLLQVTPPEPVVLLGVAGGSRLEIGGVDLRAGLTLAFADGKVTGTPSIEGEVTGGRLVIDAGSADGFIKTLLGGARLEAQFAAGFTFDPEHGLRFHGGAGLQIQIPVHLALGPLDVHALQIVVTPDAGGVSLELSANLAAALGPLKAAVERVGVTVGLRFPPDGGNLGPADLTFAFKPPNGVGLALDAGLVSGGGYLYADPVRGEYAGALELEFAGFLQLKAIGLISTRMPDGSSGFSLLIIISVDFGTGIQLGFGFTLLAVGGLVGLNRRMNLPALAEGVRSGAIESVMFPADVVANAPRIISDLRAFFPPDEGTFLIGPMAKIGWGTPTLISVSLGLIIEIPGNIAIVGVLRCLLPTKELALLALQVNFIGAIEFDKQRLWFYAELFDSRVLFMTIEGGMGLLIGWGDDAELVLTVGGFHPAFRPPPLPFPVPRRLAVDILNRPGARIRVSGYFAVTSNTVQFGAAAEMVLGFDDFGIEGHLSFDALFQFSPFAFVISVAAGVSLKAFGVGLFGIDLRFVLEGPAPWRAHGRGSISLLFFEISADFDISWGEEHNTTLPPVDVLPLLADELGKTEGWETRLPSGGTRSMVNLRPLADSDDLVLHPLGSLFVRQRAIPFGVRLDRVGQRRPHDGVRFSAGPAPDSGLVRASVTGDRFAMAQFQDLDDAAKLSRPAYEQQDAGLELVAAQGAIASARALRRSARYELIVVDSRARTQAAGARSMAAAATADAPAPAPTRRLYRVSPAVFTQLLAGSSTSRSPLSQREAGLRQPNAAADTLQLTGQRYVIAQRRNNVQAFPPAGVSSTTASFRSVAAATDTLAEWVAAAPPLAGTLHVIPEAEMVGAPATAGTWTGAGPLPTPTAFDAATDAAELLPGGAVLVAGGSDPAGDPVADTAVFDPVSTTWTAGSALGTARRGHTLTRLADGRVLAAGGLGAAGVPLAAAEVYTPLTGAWSAVSDLGTARSGHTATPLPDGRVLLAGGTGARAQGGAALAGAEIFDPIAGKFVAAAPMTDARTRHCAVALPGGSILVIGGALATGGRDAALAYCEVYDPAARTWTPTGSLTAPRAGHQATPLPDGRVLVTGGDPPTARLAGRYRSGSLDGAEVYDPTTGQWTQLEALPGGRSRHRAVALPGGRVLVLGGTGGPGRRAGYRSAATYDPRPGPGAGAWTGTGALAEGRADFAALLLADGRILVVGGRTAAGPAAAEPGLDSLTATTEIYTP